MKKTYQQLEWILAEAERVNAVLTNDYTSLKERVKNLNSDLEVNKKKATDLEASEKELKEDIDRLNLIIEYEREQRFDLEQKNDMQVVQMNKQKIELMNIEDRVTQLQETIRQQSESNKAKDEVVTQLKGKVTGLEESMKGLKGNFDDTFKLYNEAKGSLDKVESERDDYLQKFTTTKQELAHATQTISDIRLSIIIIPQNYLLLHVTDGK